MYIYIYTHILGEEAALVAPGALVDAPPEWERWDERSRSAVVLKQGKKKRAHLCIYIYIYREREREGDICLKYIKISRNTYI